MPRRRRAGDGQRAADGQRQFRPDRGGDGRAVVRGGEQRAAAGPSASGASDTPGAGTLSVSPATLNVTPPGGGSIT